MGTKIDMVAVSRPLFSFASGGSIKLSTRAAKQCIRESGTDACNIGLIINTGIYRYKNTGEPAIAAIIQKRIGANSSNRVTTDNIDYDCKNTFSFDLNNGGCGWLTGIEIVDGFIQTGQINYGMIITGDSEPFQGLSENFNFEPAAAAIILSRTEGTGGFSIFRSYSYPVYNKEFISTTFFGNMTGKLGKRNILSVRQKETYLDLCINCAEESLYKFMNETGLSLTEVDLIISSQSPAGVVKELKKRTGINDRFVDITGTGHKEFHTAGPALALKKAWDEKHFKTSKNIIFLTIGSGINISVALYTNTQ
jgi:3-oxoacyl-[acyl-carrier-protein] synthase-3